MEHRVWRQRILRVLRGLAWLAGLMVATVLWGVFVNQPPHYLVTPPVLPARNAADVYLRLDKDIRHVDELRRHDINWYSLTDQYTPKSIPPRNGARPAPAPPPPFPVTVLLKDNQPVLRRIQDSLALEYVLPLNPRETLEASYRHEGEYLQAAGHCRRLLELHAFSLLNSPDHAAAAAALVDVIAFTPPYRYLPKREAVYQALRAQVGHLTAVEARKLIAPMEKMCRHQPSYAETLARDKPRSLRNMLSNIWYIEDQRRRLLQEGNLLPLLLPPGPQQPLWQSKHVVCIWTVPDAQVPARTERYLTACIRVAQQPLSAHATYPHPPFDIMNQLTYKYDRREEDQLEFVLVQYELDGLLLSMAVRGFQQEHHRYPATLTELVTDGWLRQLPVDPFTQRDTFCYRRTATAFVLYSRGPDGRDDGGTPIMNPIYYSRSERYQVHLDSHGDVVYGLNKYMDTSEHRL